jgi:hypothetical protein
MSDNVFSTLYRARLGAEDYLTEALVFLLKILVEREPNRGLAILNRLSGLPQEAHFEHPEAVNISTQVIVKEGRLDIEIRDDQERLVYVEVKHDSPLGVRQLERYLSELRAAPFPTTRLVLLTRSRISARETTLAPNDYNHVCWYEIHNWLAEMEVRDEVCQYFILSLMRFLEEKQMSMEKVPQEYIEGVSALLNLTNMMEASITEAIPKADYKKTPGWSWRGFNIEGGYFYGIRHRQPSLVVYENNLGTRPTYKRDLDLDSVDFFSLSNGEQFECLVGFLRKASNDVASNL